MSSNKLDELESGMDRHSLLLLFSLCCQISPILRSSVPEFGVEGCIQKGPCIHIRPNRSCVDGDCKLHMCFSLLSPDSLNFFAIFPVESKHAEYPQRKSP